MGIGALLLVGMVSVYHPSFVLAYEEACAIAKRSLEGTINCQPALEGY